MSGFEPEKSGWFEPSGAAALAAAMREGKGRCAVILSGGNVDPELLAEVALR